MRIELGVLFSVIATLLGVFATYFRMGRDEKKNREDRETRIRENERRETERHVEIRTSLSNLTSIVQNVVMDQRSIEKELDKQNERITRVEESTKSAHKRVDTMENDLKECQRTEGKR